jgi:hypothetical protein
MDVFWPVRTSTVLERFGIIPESMRSERSERGRIFGRIYVKYPNSPPLPIYHICQSDAGLEFCHCCRRFSIDALLFGWKELILFEKTLILFFKKLNLPFQSLLFSLINFNAFFLHFHPFLN